MSTASEGSPNSFILIILEVLITVHHFSTLNYLFTEAVSENRELWFSILERLIVKRFDLKGLGC
jgi:hypothetical protein